MAVENALHNCIGHRMFNVHGSTESKYVQDWW